MTRSVGEIRADLEREREELADSAAALRTEVDHSLDVRALLREHPAVKVALALGAVVTGLLLLALVVSVVRAVAGLFGR